jgi:hypothetical protein
MRLDEIGAVENTDDLDLELTIPIVGYDKDKNKIVTDIRFLPRMPLGFGLDMLEAVGSGGNDVGIMKTFVTECIMDDDLDTFNELIRSKEVFVEITTLMSVFNVLADVYSGKNHPLEKPSSSSTGKPKTARTSKAAASKPVSNQRRSA